MIASFLTLVIAFILGLQWEWFGSIVEKISIVLYFLAMGCGMIVCIIIGIILYDFVRKEWK